MNLEDYRTLFATVSLVLILAAAFPSLNAWVSFPSDGEHFSELWLLGLTHMAEGYPFNVSVGEDYSVYVGVGNHMGYSGYYMVYVKFRNQTQPLPNSTMPSSLPPLYEFRVFLLDGEKWEGLLRFKFLEVLRQANTVRVKRMMINNFVFEMDSVSRWDLEYGGYYFQLFFELWLYDMTLQPPRFEYYKRGFVGVWLNMTT